jgi:hypothetical protein
VVGIITLIFYSRKKHSYNTIITYCTVNSNKAQEAFKNRWSVYKLIRATINSNTLFEEVQQWCLSRRRNISDRNNAHLGWLSEWRQSPHSLVAVIRIIGVLLDIVSSSAFALILYSLLSRKLGTNGLPASYINWFFSYIANKQRNVIFWEVLSSNFQPSSMQTSIVKVKLSLQQAMKPHRVVSLTCRRLFTPLEGLDQLKIQLPYRDSIPLSSGL